jgi:hypothetical protein
VILIIKANKAKGIAIRKMKKQREIAIKGNGFLVDKCISILTTQS